MNVNFKHYNHLSFLNPFNFNKKNQFEYSYDFSSILNFSQKKLDVVAVTQVLNYGYILGDRTLIEDIKKSPWMAKPNQSNNTWEYFDLPSHQEKKLDINFICNKLFDELKNELKQYINDKVNIGFLLTGGMDSRIVAAVLSNILKDNSYNKITVHTFTWGDTHSRDVVYAKQISNLYNWKWKHLNIDDEQLKENINFTIDNGCEFSPIHLHAMSKLNHFANLDCVLAGSFGDSIGRGEYSGKKVLNIKPLNANFKNSLSLLNNEIYKKFIESSNQDILHYQNQFPQEKNYQQIEQDYQLHYMRRMLNPCFKVISEQTPVYQMFSSPQVFGFMWSVHPSLRTDDIYYNILKNESPELLDIPWARTGLPFPDTNGTPDNYNDKTIDYGSLIRKSFLIEIENELLNGSLIKKNIISSKRIKSIIRLIRLKPIDKSYFFEDKLIWLYCLQKFINQNNLSLKTYKNNFRTNKELIKEYYLRLVFYKYKKKIKQYLK